jgi:hypothetical protein
MMIDRKIFFDSVRASLFGGSMDQSQVDGQSFILDEWEQNPVGSDRRWLAYALGTTYHETSKEMQPIEEYGKGSGMSYGRPDPVTGQTYYGRGYVQLTWRSNYERATRELGLSGSDDLEWHAERALDQRIAADVMFLGMAQGWFRSGSDGKPNSFPKYFSASKEDPYNAREIVNGDKSTVPSWSNGVSIGDLIVGYYDRYLDAIEAASEPEPPDERPVVTVDIGLPLGVRVAVTVNGEPLVIDDEGGA